MAEPGPVEWLEIHAENYMGEGGRPIAQIRHLAEKFPISVHGVGLSIGGEGPLDRPDHVHLARAGFQVVPEDERDLGHHRVETSELQEDVHHAGEPGLVDEPVPPDPERPAEDPRSVRAESTAVVANPFDGQDDLEPAKVPDPEMPTAKELMSPSELASISISSARTWASSM